MVSCIFVLQSVEFMEYLALNKHPIFIAGVTGFAVEKHMISMIASYLHSYPSTLRTRYPLTFY